jgi:methionyl-tRNA synthetase
VVATAAQPFIPDGASRLLDLLNVPEDKRQFRVEQAALVPGTALPKPEGVFPRYVEQEAAS